MANMSYCRFHNTRADVMDCIGALQEGDQISDEERLHCVGMFSSIIDYLEEEGIVELDWEAFDEWAEGLKERS